MPASDVFRNSLLDVETAVPRRFPFLPPLADDGTEARAKIFEMGFMRWSFMSQGHHGINLCSAARREPAGERADDAEEQCHCKKRNQIARSHAEKL